MHGPRRLRTRARCWQGTGLGAHGFPADGGLSDPPVTRTAPATGFAVGQAHATRQRRRRQSSGPKRGSQTSAAPHKPCKRFHFRPLPQTGPRRSVHVTVATWGTCDCCGDRSLSERETLRVSMRPDHHDIHNTPHDHSRPRSAERRSSRRARPIRRRRTVAVAVAALTAVGALSACSSSGGGKVTLNFYAPPDNSGAIQSAANNCGTSQYRINYIRLPNAADGQRSSWCAGWRRRTARSTSSALDVTWEAEFAEAGWIKPWTGANKAAGRVRHAEGAAADRDWKGKLYARPGEQQHPAALVPLRPVPNPPKTWDRDDRRWRSS